MRLAFVVSSLWLSGGVNTVVEYATRLAARGHVVSIVTPDGAVDTNVLERIAKSVRVVEAGTAVEVTASVALKVRLNLALARAVPAAEAVIATHTPTILPSLAASLGKKGTRLYWFYQDYIEMFKDRPVERLLLRTMPRFCRHVLVVSRSAAQEMYAYGARSVTVVREGISDEVLFYPPAAPSSREEGMLLYLGDMRPRKGLFDFLAAVEQLYPRQPKIRLVLVSKSECNIDTKLPLEFYFRPPRSELAELFRRCSAFVSASWWESFGLPPLEAMACGAPVVLTDSRGVREYARDKENCLVVPAHDPCALALSIERVLTDKTLSCRLSEAGPATAKEFKWDDCVDRFERVLLNSE